MDTPPRDDSPSAPQGDADAETLIREVAAALRMARWGGVEAVERRRLSPSPAAPQPALPVRASAHPVGSPRAPAAVLQTAVAAAVPATQGPLLPAVPSILVRPPPGLTVPAQPSPDEQMRALQGRADSCTRCPRHGGRRLVVHGQGNPEARLLVLLDSPSAEDEAVGQVATGRGGELLDAMLAAMGLNRQQIWLCYLVQCRDGDRTPTAEEVTACSGWLLAQWKIVRPQVALAMGLLPAQLMARQAKPLAELRGQWFDVRGTAALATWAPEDLLAADKALKRQAWDDLRQVMARLGLR